MIVHQLTEDEHGDDAGSQGGDDEPTTNVTRFQRMITSAGHRRWPLDVPVADLSAAGLPAPSVVRLKIFTLDDRLVERRVGALIPSDASAVQGALGRLFGVLDG